MTPRENAPPGVEEFRAALLRVPSQERDAWLDRAWGLDTIPDDGPALPRGCVPYLPSSVDVVLRMIEQANIGANDVFVDIGCGVGRVALLVKMLTGASVVGLEVQPHLAAGARELAARLGMALDVVEGDASDGVPAGSVYFLYCPFGGARLKRVWSHLEIESKRRCSPLRICTVDLPVAEHDWLKLILPIANDLVVYESGIEGHSEETPVAP